MTFQLLKKSLVLILVTFAITFVGISNINAQGGNAELVELQKIRVLIENILSKVNQLPTYINDSLSALNALAMGWLNTEDEANVIGNVQGDFTSLGTLITDGITAQLNLQNQLNRDLLSNSNVVTSGVKLNPRLPTPAQLPHANDILYSTIIGSPFYTADPRLPLPAGATLDSAYNYIKNAAGINMIQTLPGNWSGNPVDVAAYKNYFDTITAIKSFSGYVLSSQYADANKLNTLQTTLVTKATDPTKWIAQIAGEKIGLVLRQLLLYESQSFVLLTQLLQTQKQMVTAQVMTNTLLILNARNTETIMIPKAQGLAPTG